MFALLKAMAQGRLQEKEKTDAGLANLESCFCGAQLAIEAAPLPIAKADHSAVSTSASSQHAGTFVPAPGKAL